MRGDQQFRNGLSAAFPPAARLKSPRSDLEPAVASVTKGSIFDPLAKPSVNIRKLRIPAGWSRRWPVIADRDRGRNLGGGIAVVQASGIPVLQDPRATGLRPLIVLYETEKLKPFAT